MRRSDGRTVGPGDRVLIDGASGNVGPFAVQVAKARGAVVTGVASPSKLDLVRSLGADQVIDYTTTDYTRSGERYDWILDTDSHHSIRSIRRALRPNGVYVTLGGTAWPLIRALTLGPLLSIRSDRWSGLLLWWKPFPPTGRGRAARPDRRRSGPAGHRPDVSARRDRGSAEPRERRTGAGQGDRHDARRWGLSQVRGAVVGEPTGPSDIMRA